MSIFQKLIRSNSKKFGIGASAPLNASVRHRLIYRALEPRMVFDAALQATISDAVMPQKGAAEGPVICVMPEIAGLPGGAVLDAAHAVDVTGGLSAPNAIGETLVFVDPRVSNFQDIARALPQGATVIALTTTTGGLEQISSYLEGRANVAGIQIFSHGTAAHLQIGADVLDNANLASHSAALQQIGRALSGNGDILLYGCDVAAENDGRQFVEALAQFTGGDVAASVDATGAAAFGGNWILELSTGSIETTAVSASDFHGLLGAAAVDDVNVVAANAVTAIFGSVLTNDAVVTVVTEVQGRTAAVGVASTTTYGTITLNSDGTYNYVVDRNNETVRSLVSGQSITDIVSYTATNGATGSDAAYLIVTINGIDRDDVLASTPATVPVVSSDLIVGMPTVPNDAVSVVFVDPRISNYQQIVTNIAPGSAIIVLDPTVAGLEQIAAYLQGHTGIESIQILSHGAEAQLQLITRRR
jgi:VCBS repeat-containing protein